MIRPSTIPQFEQIVASAYPWTAWETRRVGKGVIARSSLGTIHYCPQGPIWQCRLGGNYLQTGATLAAATPAALQIPLPLEVPQ